MSTPKVGNIDPFQCWVTKNDPVSGESSIDYKTSSQSPHQVYPLNKEYSLKSYYNIWKMDQIPTNCLHGDNIPSDHKIPLAPPEKGLVFRIVDFPPDKDYLDSENIKQDKINESFKNIGLENGGIRNENSHSKHPMMHCTRSVDFGIVLKGEIYLILDKEIKKCVEGDVIVQKATNHAWSNKSDKMCRMAFVLVAAEEK